jgi:hypothetical protein
MRFVNDLVAFCLMMVVVCVLYSETESEISNKSSGYLDHEAFGGGLQSAFSTDLSIAIYSCHRDYALIYLEDCLFGIPKQEEYLRRPIHVYC